MDRVNHSNVTQPIMYAIHFISEKKLISSILYFDNFSEFPLLK
jgi:hypothetical protein